GLDLQMGGTRAAPTFRGTASLADGRFGEASLPVLRGVVDYADRRLQADIRMWRTGDPVMSLQADLPLNLAFQSVERRQVPGELMVQVKADSLDLAVIEAATSSVTDVTGTVQADIGVRGTWDDPALDGSVELHDGAMAAPGLGVRFGTIAGRVVAEGDSLRADRFYLTSGGGRLDVGGSVLLRNLADPVLALDLKADQFRAIDVKNFLTLVASGDMQLRGPVYHAALTGDITANSGVLYFADLLEKNVIDLSDPVNADLVDTTLIRRRNLGPRFQNVFLDSLRVNDLRLTLGSDVWLRSNEANIQLDGRLRVNKEGREYLPAGTLQTLRGTYTLKIGPVSRDFSVDRGNVQYLGTPDLNANLDITARHVVRTSNYEIPVVARIEGTLLHPKLSLTSGPNIQPPIPEVDLVSYLIFGVPSSQAQLLGQGKQLSVAASYVTSAFSSELERALVSDLGLPVDLIEIRPGVGNGAGGSNITQVTAGWQIGTKLFFTVNAGLCGGNLSGLGAQSIGTSLEFRFSQEWRSQLSLAPTFQDCGIRGFGNTLTPNTRYQIGVDLLWDREF
ncbi:MAG TPA: translocation/assembly module TamB domain-containing protein, partial [Gemmatimonadales bacterium]|nr:translocation/assembly module TamB domain-containing protein [Gemmatimonadales bacterium]